MIEVEVCLKRSSVNHPNEVPVERFSCLTFRISHAGVLDFNVDAGRCSDVSPMNLSNRSDVVDLPTVLRKATLPLPVPLGLIFPPGVAVPCSGMSPVVDHPRSAFCNHLGATAGARGTCA